MAALSKMTLSPQYQPRNEAEAYVGRHRILDEFRRKIERDLAQLENSGQIRDARETLDVLATVLDHRLL